MARFALAFACAAVLVAVASAQFDYFGGLQGGFAAPRDPRANRGPVTFPVTQPGAETSGVRVGASGYGFVPPGQRGGRKILYDDAEEEIEMEMAGFQLAKMTDKENVRNTMVEGMLATERKGREAEEEARIKHRGLRHTLRTSMRRTGELAEASMWDAERRIAALMETWNFGKQNF